LVLSSCSERRIRGAKLRPIKVKGKTILVEIACTPETRERGLMFRKNLPRDQGMLFVYPSERYLSFWMKNTFIPLSAAFIRADGWICQIEKMQPLTLTRHLSKMPVKYVLEMNQGWFERNGVSVGDYVEIPDDIANAALTQQESPR